MKKIGIVSYNIYCNFTNYGSALQSYGLYTSINKLAKNRWQAVLVDYCPNSHLDVDCLNPLKNMWDKDEESIKLLEMSMTAIKENYYKFDNFYKTKFVLTSNKYTCKNFNEIANENINSFVCGSDTIFCIEEFGFDNGYYANYDVMKNHSVAYAASIGDSIFDKDNEKEIFHKLLNNFKSIGLRESKFVYELNNSSDITPPVRRVIDPTLLLISNEYDEIAEKRIIDKPYLLLYARRYNKKMEDYAEKYAKEHNLELVEISLRATNASKHRMFYEAGVEEFLSLVKYSSYVVTNSFHGMIFSIIYKRNFTGFTREQCGNKIYELLKLFEIQDRLVVNGDESMADIDYDKVHSILENKREECLEFLNEELEML